MRIRNRSRLGLLYLKEKDSADNFQGYRENSIPSSSSSTPLQEEEESMAGAEEDVDEEFQHDQEPYYSPQLSLSSSLEDGEIGKSSQSRSRSPQEKDYYGEFRESQSRSRSPQEAAVFLGESMGQNTTTSCSNITAAKKHKGRTLEEEDGKKQNTIIQEKVNNGTNKKRKEKERADQPEMPKHLKDVIFGDQVQGFGIKWVNTKHIYESDTKDNQNRLYLPNKEIKEVLTEEEIELARTPDNNGIAVHVFDSRLNVWKMNIKWWTCKRYVLNQQWKTFAAANNIQEGDTAEIWAFRNQLGMLCLAMNFRKGETMKKKKKKKKDQDPKGGASTSGTAKKKRHDDSYLWY